MRFSFTDEQVQFRDVLRRFLREVSPAADVRRHMASADGFDAAVWRRLADDLALPGLAIPEAHGGSGFGIVELCIAVEEQGRALLCAPYFATVVLAATAIGEAATAAQKARLLPAIAGGRLRAALAIGEARGSVDVADIACTATRSGGRHRLHGSKSFVIDGASAEQLVVVARAPGSRGADGLSCFLVDGNAGGLRRRPLASIDETRRLARLDLDGVDAELLGDEGAAAPAIARTLDVAFVALANEMMGGAQALFDATMGYMATRVQFGRLIGSFQAIKHRCADLLVELELAKSGAWQAAQALADGDAERSAHASLAKAAAADAYMHVAAESIQLHGGIGFTWDHDTHLWYKRAKCSEVLFGSPRWHRERMLRELEAAGAVEMAGAAGAGEAA
jgi:alkylation response protein AidB-like acyl-CoA dehydrogenase